MYDKNKVTFLRRTFAVSTDGKEKHPDKKTALLENTG